MIFSFLKYIKPTHYFTIKNKEGNYIYPKATELSVEVLEKLKKDNQYKSEEAKQLDLSYQAIEKGYIEKNYTSIKETNLPIEDEYRFIRKYFSSFWYVHTFLQRLLSFKNPIKEINGFLKSLKVKRVALYQEVFEYPEWKQYESNLINLAPKVSVIIPTLNRYDYLKDVLKDLENQDYKNFDVIVVDQSEPFQKDFYDGYDLDIQLIHQNEKALWLARNRAVELSDSDYLLLFDDDSRVESDWIENHLKCIDFFKAEISSGVSISKVGDKVPENYKFFKISDQLDTGNVLIKRSVFKTIGLFDRQFEKQRMGDGEYGLRAYLEGFKNISNPYAERLHLKVETGGLRHVGAWDAFRTQKWFSPRPIPSVLYLYRNYYGNDKARQSLINTIPSSLLPYRFKAKAKFKIVSYFIFLFIWPLTLFQVLKSWNIASTKLKEGAIINKLKEK